MHSVLALTQIHDSMLDLVGAKNSKTFDNHWHQALCLMQRNLTQPITSWQKDALWIATALISVGSLVTINAASPLEAWPIRPPSPSDLSWLKLCDGKRLITQITNPVRDGGDFQPVAKEFNMTLSRIENVVYGVHSFDRLPLDFYDLLELSNGPLNNPYYASAVALADILRLELSEKTFLPHLAFVSILDSKFRDLLSQRDERAMLIILYWYAKICDRRLWWMWKQAWTEGLAISEYLKRAWKREPKLITLLTWPRTTLVIASRAGIMPIKS